MEPTDRFEKDQKFYERKRPNELAAVLRNLERYMDFLKVAPNPQAIQAGFLHPEPAGVIAIDQSGGGGNLQETRLYTYPDSGTKVLFLITIGNKDEQHSDIIYSKQFAQSLKKQQ
jgi:hypothetical protein